MRVKRDRKIIHSVLSETRKCARCLQYNIKILKKYQSKACFAALRYKGTVSERIAIHSAGLQWALRYPGMRAECFSCLLL